jgi:glycosyltransferase involved in cell wall biosynthesis
VARVHRYLRAGVRSARLFATRHPNAGLRVSYGHDRIPAPGERASGGNAKFQKLAARFPNNPDDFTLLYLGSSGLPRDLGLLLALARRRGAPVVVNQDGVGYPAWAGDRTGAVNGALREALRAADHVLYQTQFCKEDADRYLGGPRGSWEILPNAVDCDRYVPGSPPAGAPVLLLAGNQTSAGRLELALRALAVVRATHAGARLLVTGELRPGARAAVAAAGDAVEVVGPYTQAEAPALYRRAHLLLHTKVLDPCPNVVLEAMASGLPVVYPASGGTPELVGDGGVPVAHEVSHDRLSLPEPEAMAAGVDAVLGDLAGYAERARRRAETQFPLGPWLDRHAELFAALLARPPK